MTTVLSPHPSGNGPHVRAELLRRFPMLALAHDARPLTCEETIVELADFIEEQSELLEIVVQTPEGTSLGAPLASALLRVSSAAAQIKMMAGERFVELRSKAKEDAMAAPAAPVPPPPKPATPVRRGARPKRRSGR